MDRIGGRTGWRRLYCALMVLAALQVVPYALAATTPEPPQSTITIGGGRIEVSCDDAGLQVSCQKMLAWVQSSAAAVTIYYGRFPVPSLHVRIVPVVGIQDIHGTTFGRKGSALIRIFVGHLTTGADLREDWVMTHEMVHLAFPSVSAQHNWIEEGIATYVEPIARAESGALDVPTVWHELVEGLPKGLPQPGDQGLDHTHTWGRTYWGGALFCLLADVELHRRTANRYGLQDALRAILNAGGNVEVDDWPLARALKAGDDGVGVPVLTELYDRMKAVPSDPDLATLWKKLGVQTAGKTVTFDDNAPWAAIRRAITAKPR